MEEKDFILHVDNDLELVLRHASDAEVFFGVITQNRAYLTRWFPWAETSQLAETASYIQTCQETFAKGTGLDLGIRYKGEWIGSAGLRHIVPEHRKAEIGYWLDESHQGQGIMTKCIASLIKHAFTKMGLNRLWMRIDTENQKSAGVAARLGFKEEGILRQDQWLHNHWQDHRVFSLLREEWEPSRALRQEQ